VSLLHCKGKVIFRSDFSATTVSPEQLVQKRGEEIEIIEAIGS